MNEYRTHNCGELNIKNVGEEIKLSGWIGKIRNLGGMTFIDLRDESGITQIVIENNEKTENMCKDLTTETCIKVEGNVVERASKNNKMATGDIEIVANNIEILGKCKNVLPFEINSNDLGNVREDLRLEYRFLELRNEHIHKNIILRPKRT